MTKLFTTLLPAIAVGLGAIGLWTDTRALRSLRVWYGLKTTPVSAPSAVVPEDQLVKVQGRARAVGVEAGGAPPLRSRLGGKPCFYSDYHLETESLDSKGRSTWSTERREIEGTPFIVEDPTGAGVLVDPRAASDILPKETGRESGYKYRVTERTIGPGLEVLACGRAVPPKSAATGARAVLEPDSRGVLILSAHGEAPVAADYRLGTLGWLLCGAFSLALAARLLIVRLRPPRI